MDTDLILSGTTVVLALCGVAATVVESLTDKHTYAGAMRARRAGFAAPMFLLGAAAAAWSTGELVGAAVGTIWFAAATAQIPRIKSRRQVSRQLLAEQEKRRTQLDKEAKAVDDLARSLNLPPTPRINNPDGST